ncbi:MAG TPA: hypothetical protein VHD32_17545 [Candidatus Didemnitutus sp.]|nr:hypothetical protein [Candidatus Didemnitutus sp.]
MLKAVTLTSIGLSFMLVACERSAPPLTIPAASAVVSIEADGVMQPGPNIVMENTWTGRVHVTDAKAIAAIIGLLIEMKDGMHFPDGLSTTPTGRQRIIVHDNANNRLVIFVGPSWILGRNIVGGVSSEDRLRTISANQHQHLLDLLGINDPTP